MQAQQKFMCLQIETVLILFTSQCEFHKFSYLVTKKILCEVTVQIRVKETDKISVYSNLVYFTNQRFDMLLVKVLQVLLFISQ